MSKAARVCRPRGDDLLRIDERDAVHWPIVLQRFEQLAIHLINARHLVRAGDDQARIIRDSAIDFASIGNFTAAFLCRRDRPHLDDLSATAATRVPSCSCHAGDRPT